MWEAPSSNLRPDYGSQLDPVFNVGFCAEPALQAVRCLILLPSLAQAAETRAPAVAQSNIWIRPTISLQDANSWENAWIRRLVMAVRTASRRCPRANPFGSARQVMS